MCVARADVGRYVLCLCRVQTCHWRPAGNLGLGRNRPCAVCNPYLPHSYFAFALEFFFHSTIWILCHHPPPPFKENLHYYSQTVFSEQMLDRMYLGPAGMTWPGYYLLSGLRATDRVPAEENMGREAPP